MSLRAFVLIALAFMMFGLYAWPMWTGELFVKESPFANTRARVPTYLLEAAEWLNTQPEDFNIFPVPFAMRATSAYWWFNGTGGYRGVPPEVILLNKRVIFGTTAGAAIAEQIADGDFNDARILALLNVKYVMAKLDSNWDLIESSTDWIAPRRDRILSILQNIADLQFERSFGPIHFYANKYWRPIRLHYTTLDPCANVSFQMLSLGETHRQSILVYGNVPSEFQMRLMVPYLEGMRPDFGDVRFTSSSPAGSEENLVDYWLEYFSEDRATFFVRLPFVKALSRVYLYYGNPLLSGRGDPGRAFFFAAGFHADPLSEWTRVEGSWRALEIPSLKSPYSFLAGPDSIATGYVQTTAAVFNGTYRFESNSSYYYVFLPVTDSGQSVYAVVAKSDGHFGYYDSAYHNFPIDITYSPGKWYDVSVMYNVTSMAYWVRINNTLVTPSGLPLFEYESQRVVRGGSYFTSLRIITKQSPMIVNGITLASLGQNVQNVRGLEEQLNFFEDILRARWEIAGASKYAVESPPAQAKYLVLEESYHDAWVAQDSVRDTPLEHCKAFGFLNAWRVQAGNGPIRVVFVAERFLYLGQATSVISAILLIAVTVQRKCARHDEDSRR